MRSGPAPRPSWAWRSCSDDLTQPHRFPGKDPPGKRDDCFKILIVSVYCMGGAVVQLALALFFASLMVFGVKGSSIYKACMFFPYLICGIQGRGTEAVAFGGKRPLTSLICSQDNI